MADGQRERAFEQALGALRRRERSAAELREWLAGRGFDPVEVDAAVERLTELGELDDERFARLFAEDKRELAGWGSERVAEALRRRGVAGELIERFASAEPHAEQVERAAALLGGRGQLLDGDRARARALGFLTRRGFGYEVAYDAVRRAEREAA